MFSSSQVSLFTARMGELVKGPIITVERYSSIFLTSQKMTSHGVGSIVVVDDKIPIGIITKTDLVRRVLAKNLPAETQIEKVMSQNIVSIQIDSPIIDGLMLMIKHNIGHILVKNGASVYGVVSEHDWLTLQKEHPAAVIRSIDDTHSIDKIAEIRQEISKLIFNIFEEEGNTLTLSRLVTEVNDRITCQIINIVIKEMEAEGLGQPPVSFAWIGMGSEGRKAQTISTDQDNGIIFENVAEKEMTEVKKWFLKFATRVIDGLEKCGFPRCKGNIMAENPELCLSFDDWVKTFTKIIAYPDPVALLKASIYFDFRCLYGEIALAEKLWDSLLGRIKKSKSFLRYLAGNMMTANRPPINTFRWRLNKWFGIRPSTINIKREALSPLVDVIRILALLGGISKTSSLERLKSAKELGIISETLEKTANGALDFIKLLRIRHEFSLDKKNKPHTNIINLKTLNSLELNFLRDSLQAGYDLQDFVNDKVGGVVEV